ncbi:Dihydroprymidine dehydrogenase domain II, 4Fe-4S cluster [Aduncisulcus paluster]|uniref:Dihydrothymine dehydrogenase n=1 Tax=Aduncisulcus paluster TaxID=2918883 RepID=A0ABQ5KPR6_9EUKA|nr:Dihydroprymidine dehydrogenase domain II, 4Fe-4S cluster [Aduncisulcus paluster]|eukprot:gnl/Carplike_NY0171/2437_a3275_729.p1 GENE.gnl/Carplike_NY0171/2437_a3275_729~~gnl/Carplike_NY0171/2437_a3275_729.p1  ORF type:complete len:873 (+),score=319.22 gnl/Carplike_NY0171/2437_a3275_729:36-2654(+)
MPHKTFSSDCPTGCTAILGKPRLIAEGERCLYCETAGCQKGCPADCSPKDFIRAIELGTPHDFSRAAGMILSKNPIGSCCGAICPDKFCQLKCARRKMDTAIEIPKTQSSIIAKADSLGVFPKFEKPKMNGKKVAIIGAGPSGLACAAVLGQRGYKVVIYDSNTECGGALLQIPKERLNRSHLERDIKFILSLGENEFKAGVTVSSPEDLIKEGFDSVVVAAGCQIPRKLRCEGEEHAISAVKFLTMPLAEQRDLVKGKSVAVIGGGAVMVDCVTTSRRRGADDIHVMYRRTIKEMPLCSDERTELLEADAQIVTRTIPKRILEGKGIETIRVKMGTRSQGAKMSIVEGSEYMWPSVDVVIVAAGSSPNKELLEKVKGTPGVFAAGDFVFGSSTAVEAVAVGKECAADVDEYITAVSVYGKDSKEAKEHECGPRLCRMLTEPTDNEHVHSEIRIDGWNPTPVPLDHNFMGIPLINPFVLSASPLTDSYENCKKAYEAGWAGCVLKTAFDGLPIHIPESYMTKYGSRTTGNCDNVSGRHLSQMVEDIKRLVKEFPDRMTVGGTGGPVTGDDEFDRAGWVKNTHILEDAGAHAVAYSLSCPQGGDGSEGAIVSQNAELSAKIVEYVLAGCKKPEVPKLFKLTAAVTSIKKIVETIKKVFDKYPHCKAGITLANSFPTVNFKPTQREGRVWEDAIMYGAHGEGVTGISYLSLTSVFGLGVDIAGNGGPCNYKAAADFLALGCGIVKFCTAPTIFGYDWINELCSGVSHLMAHRGIKSVKELIGCAGPEPVCDFMEIKEKKRIPVLVRPQDCVLCGNCHYCPNLAFGIGGFHKVDPYKCVGCAECVLMCPSQCLEMQERPEGVPQPDHGRKEERKE